MSLKLNYNSILETSGIRATKIQTLNSRQNEQGTQRIPYGFTLIELMITVAIIGIIAAIGIPSYLDYTRKAHFSELVQATGPYTVGIADCYQTQGSLENCNAGFAGIPPAITTPLGKIASLSVERGQITVTPIPANGLVATDTYILNPTINNGAITWSSSGGGVSKGYAK